MLEKDSSRANAHDHWGTVRFRRWWWQLGLGGGNRVWEKWTQWMEVVKQLEGEVKNDIQISDLISWLDNDTTNWTEKYWEIGNFYGGWVENSHFIILASDLHVLSLSSWSDIAQFRFARSGKHAVLWSKREFHLFVDGCRTRLSMILNEEHLSKDQCLPSNTWYHSGRCCVFALAYKVATSPMWLFMS